MRDDSRVVKEGHWDLGVKDTYYEKY